ncbi:adhesin-like protein [Reticulomyxa filosa]|uniref:Adhesin-like protein n=1 Tax=Reticulomyxa filosa TaxID=46433 RepID=X6N9A1_RETFI|nr:adhesin-like protein [Reticulomyxa filosa]|eukprot:ETO22483.1 adhesin-like protein [Reticulomyxa filosa]
MVQTSPNSSYFSGNIILLFSEENRFDELDNAGGDFYHYNDIETSVVWIDNSHFFNNWNTFAGGVLTVESAMDTFGLMSITNSRFTQNTVWKNGGVLHFHSSMHIAGMVNLTNHSLPSLSLIAGLRLYVDNCTFEENSATPDFPGQPIKFFFFFFPFNDGNVIGGGGALHLFVYHNTTGGKQVVSPPTPPDNSPMPLDHELYWINSQFQRNSVVNDNQNGGAVYLNYVLDAHNSTYINASFDNLPTLNYHILHIDNCDFSHHISKSNGGAFWFEYNERNNNQDFQNQLQLRRKITIENTTFLNNKAAFSAGAMYMQSGKAVLTLASCSFYNNSAKLQHGALWVLLNAGGNINFDQCTFIQNSVINGTGGALSFEIDMSINEQAEQRPVQTLRRTLLSTTRQLAQIPTGSPVTSPTVKFSPTAAPITTYAPTLAPTAREAQHFCPNITISSTIFANNSAVNGKGGAIFVGVYQDVRCINWITEQCTFASNYALYGGAVGIVRMNQSTYHTGN